MNNVVIRYFIISAILLFSASLLSNDNSKWKSTNGIEIYNKALAQDGITLVNGCILMDMEGNRLKDFPGVLCQYFENGDIISGVDGNILFLFNKDLSPIWRKELPQKFEGVHHEINITSDSTFLFLSSEIKNRIPYKHRPLAVTSMYSGLNFGKDSMRYDVICEMNTKGDVIFKWSAYDYFYELMKVAEKNRNAAYLDTFTWFVPELTHFNSLQELPDNPLQKSHPEFAKGNILVSDIAYKFIGIIDRKTLKFVWSFFQPTMGKGQHAARMLPNGNILFFVNEVHSKTNTGIKYSKVVELNPVTKKYVWEYIATPPESFYSEFDGNVQRLTNGNTLITVNNRNILNEKNHQDDYPEQWVFEITRNKKIVWKWVPPLVDEYTRQTEGFYRVERISKEKIKPFLEP